MLVKPGLVLFSMPTLPPARVKTQNYHPFMKNTLTEIMVEVRKKQLTCTAHDVATQAQRRT